MNVDDLTLGQARELIDQAFNNGFESDDSFLLSCNIDYKLIIKGCE